MASRSATMTVPVHWATPYLRVPITTDDDGLTIEDRPSLFGLLPLRRRRVTVRYTELGGARIRNHARWTCLLVSVAVAAVAVLTAWPILVDVVLGLVALLFVAMTFIRGIEVKRTDGRSWRFALCRTHEFDASVALLDAMQRQGMQTARDGSTGRGPAKEEGTDVNVLLVYESMYGNTAHVADAIAEGLRHGEITVTACNVDDANAVDIGTFDMLVVGGPTHMHGVSRAMTRKTAIGDKKNTYDDPTVGAGLRAWLDTVPDGGGKPAAVFDTRFDKSPFVTGEASKGIRKALEHRHHDVLERNSFFIDSQNALEDGELDRARSWGRALAEHFAVAAR